MSNSPSPEKTLKLLKKRSGSFSKLPVNGAFQHRFRGTRGKRRSVYLFFLTSVLFGIHRNTGLESPVNWQLGKAATTFICGGINCSMANLQDVHTNGRSPDSWWCNCSSDIDLHRCGSGDCKIPFAKTPLYVSKVCSPHGQRILSSFAVSCSTSSPAEVEARREHGWASQPMRADQSVGRHENKELRPSILRSPVFLTNNCRDLRRGIGQRELYTSHKDPVVPAR